MSRSLEKVRLRLRSRTMLQCCEGYSHCNNKVTRDRSRNNDVSGLTLANDIVRLREILLATTMLQGLSLLPQEGRADWRDRARDDEGARSIAPLRTTMERCHAQIRRHEAYCSKNNKVAKDRARGTDVARLREIALARTMSQDRARNTDVARLREIALARTMSKGHHRNNKVARIGEIVQAMTMWSTLMPTLS